MELLEKADTHVKAGEFDKAIDAFIEAQEFDEAGGVLSWCACDFYKMGQAAMLLNWFESIGRDVLATRPALLLLWGKIFCNDYSRHDEALLLFQQAELIYLELQNEAGEFEARVWQSVSFRQTGQGAKSLEVVESAFSDLPDISNEWVLAWATRCYADSYIIVGQVVRAMALLEKCLEDFLRLKDSYYVALCYQDMGFCLEKLVKLDEAEYYYRESAVIFHGLGNENDEVYSLNSLACLFCLTRRYSEALELLDTCLDIVNRVGSPLIRSIILESKADVYRLRGDYFKAIDFYEESMKLAVVAKSRELECCNLISTGECHLRLGALSDSLASVDRAVRISRSNGLNTEYGKSMALMSRIFALQGRGFAGLHQKSILHLSSDILAQNRERLYLAQGLLVHNHLSLSAYNLLLDVLEFLAIHQDGIFLLSDVINDCRILLEFFSVHPKASLDVKLELKRLLDVDVIGAKNDCSLWLFGLGEPKLTVINGKVEFYELRSRTGKLRGFLPEFLMQLVLSGMVSSSEIGESLWPGVCFSTVRHRIKGLISLLRDYAGSNVVQKPRRNQYLLENCWSDVCVFLELFNRFQLGRKELGDELRFLSAPNSRYLLGCDLSPSGELFRAEIKEKVASVWTF